MDMIGIAEHSWPLIHSLRGTLKQGSLGELCPDRTSLVTSADQALETRVSEKDPEPGTGFMGLPQRPRVITCPGPSSQSDVSELPPPPHSNRVAFRSLKSNDAIPDA